MAVISGRVKWACVQRPNTKFEPEYSVDVVLDMDKAKELRAAGYNVRRDKDGDLILKLKKKATKADGTPNQPPRVVDRNKQPTNVLIGNGSICNVQYTPHEWTFAGKTGTKAILNAIQIDTLVEFSQDEFDVLDEGAEGSSKPAAAQSEAQSGSDEPNFDDFDDDIPF